MVFPLDLEQERRFGRKDTVSPVLLTGSSGNLIRQQLTRQTTRQILAALISGFSISHPRLPPPMPTSGSQPCALCSSPSLYTCPRCSLRTCSLPCSRLHKSRSSCTGERDPTAYVRLRDVGQGVWADDYRWLEEGRRKVAEWGEGMPRAVKTRSGVGRERGRYGGSGGGTKGQREKRGKVEGVRAELGRRGCEVVFLPEGMGRRKMNQSTWNPRSARSLPLLPSKLMKNRTQTLHLTVQLSVPPNLLKLEDKAALGPKLISHPRVHFAHPDQTSLPTLASLLPPHLKVADIILALPFDFSAIRHTPPSFYDNPRAKFFYPVLDTAKSVAENLRGTLWVEFPTIRVISRKEWEGMLRVKGVERVIFVPFAEGVTETGGAGTGGRTRDSGWGAKRKVPVENVQRTARKAKVAPAPDMGLVALEVYESAEENEPDEIEPDEDEDEQYEELENGEVIELGEEVS